MRKDIIQMSQKELVRLRVIHQVMDGKLTQVKAAKQLDVSERQVRRMLCKVKEEGDNGIIHGSRGRPSSRKLKEKTLRRIAAMIKKPLFQGFGPTLLAEKLWDRKQIKVSREKLRQLMIAEKIWEGRSAKKQGVHTWRQRREQFGEMIQMDGSDHDWLEGRGRRLTLMGDIDDATGKFYGRFYEYEGTYPAMDSFKRYILKYGSLALSTMTGTAPTKQCGNPIRKKRYKDKRMGIRRLPERYERLGSNRSLRYPPKPRRGLSGHLRRYKTDW